MIEIKRIALLLLVASLLVPAPRAATQDGEAPVIEEVADPIIELLADHARAFKEKNEDLLMRTVDGRIADRERESLNNAQKVPFTTYTLHATTQYSGDLASPRIDALYRGQEVVTYHVVEETKIADETGTYEEDGVYTFLRQPDRDGYDGWRIGSKDDLEVLGFFSPYHLWDEKPVEVLESDRFILLTHPDVVDVLRPVLEVAETAYDRAAEFWPGEQRDKYVIIVPSTTEELGRIMHETVDLGKFVAFVAAGADRDDGWVPTGPRMFIHLSHLDNYSKSGQTEIIAHELIHAVTREASGPHIPTWVEEGIANLGGGTGSGVSPKGGALPDEFPSRERFVSGPVGGIQKVYAQSQVAVQAIVDEFGMDGLADFYAELGSRRVVPGTESHHLRTAIADSVGWTHQQWLDAWRERLR